MSTELIEIAEGETTILKQTWFGVERPPSIILAEATEAARALKDVISKKAKPVMFNGEQFLEFEDWQVLGRFYGVTAKEDGDPEVVEIGDSHGFKASSVALFQGQVISRATAYCFDDEPNWSQKPLFQLASMAQTRANSKVLRNVLAWVVVLAGYKPTPAEEMDGLREPQKSRPEPSQAPSRGPAENPSGLVLPFGKSKGKALGDPSVPLDDLQWVEGALEQSLADPDKAKYRRKNEALKEAICEEINRRAAEALHE